MTLQKQPQEEVPSSFFLPPLRNQPGGSSSTQTIPVGCERPLVVAVTCAASSVTLAWVSPVRCVSSVHVPCNTRALMPFTLSLCANTVSRALCSLHMLTKRDPSSVLSNRAAGNRRRICSKGRCQSSLMTHDGAKLQGEVLLVGNLGQSPASEQTHVRADEYLMSLELPAQEDCSIFCTVDSRVDPPWVLCSCRASLFRRIRCKFDLRGRTSSS